MGRLVLRQVWARHRGDVLAVTALALVSLAYFWRPLLSRGVWVPTGGGDVASFIYPMFVFAARSLADGSLPLWNPSLHAGMPFAADLQSGLFYPLNWPALARGAALGYRDLQATVLVHYPLAAALTYWFARELGMTRPAAWIAGLVFMLSGFLVTHLGHANRVQSAIWLPLEMLLARRALARPSYGYAMAAGAVVALAFLAGHPQMVMLQLLAVSAMVLSMPVESAWRTSASIRRRLLVLVLLGSTACGLAALKLLPAFELTRHSIRADLGFERATEFAAQPIGLATLVLPHLWGSNPTNYWGPWSNTEVLGYVGILPLLLAALSPLLKRGYLTSFFAAVGILALLLSLGDATALFGWVYRFLPGFDQVRAAGRYLYLFDFAVAIGAGFGLDGLRRLVESKHEQFGDERRIVTWAARMLAVLLVAVLGFALPLFLYQQAIDPNLVPRAIAAISDLFFLAIYLAASLVVLGIALRRWLDARALTALILVIATFDLASAYHSFNPTTVDPLAGFRHDALVERLVREPDLFRIDSETGAIENWQPDSANLYGLQDAGGLFNPMQLANYLEFRKAVGRDYSSPAYDLLGVRYLVGAADFAPAGAPGDFELLERYPDGLTLYQHREALPRARIVYRAIAVDGFESAMRALRDPGFDPRHTALVEGPPIDNPAAHPASDAEIQQYRPNRVDLKVNAAADGYLVLADAAYPGWRAWVDGQEQPLVTAYGVFRAMRVGPGEHQITLEFVPFTWEVGWRISALTLILLIGVALWGPLRRLYAPARARPSANMR